MPKYTDAELIAKCLDKDASAWAEFIRRYSSLISFTIKRALIKYRGFSDSQEAKDIEQGIFVSLWRGNKLAEVEDRSRIEYWLAAVALNAVINHSILKNREIPSGGIIDFETIGLKESPSPLGSILARDTVNRLYTRLTTREKLVLKLYFEKEKGEPEIASILNTSLNSVSSTISKIRKKLKKLT